MRVPEDETADPTLLGFLEQTRNVLVGVKAVISRAIEEGYSLVLEGVHLVPGSISTSIRGAVVCHCLLAIEDDEEHANHFWSRDAASEGCARSRSTSPPSRRSAHPELPRGPGRQGEASPSSTTRASTQPSTGSSSSYSPTSSRRPSVSADSGGCRCEAFAAVTEERLSRARAGWGAGTSRS